LELNLLLVTIDTLRPDRLSCYNPKHLETPRIDALAPDDALFNDNFGSYYVTVAVTYLKKGDKAKGHWQTVLDIPSS
jgi:hypothetical protein